VIREPGMVAGAQDTALQPMAWPLKISAPHCPSSGALNYDDASEREMNTLLKVKTEILPSDEAQARIAPNS
jgi:hypothetical protein